MRCCRRWDGLRASTRSSPVSTVRESRTCDFCRFPTAPARYPQTSTGLSTGAEPDAAHELVDLVEHLVTLGHERLDLLHRVDDGRVVAAAELLGDARIGEVGQLAEDVHPDLARDDERPPPALPAEVL